MLKELEVAAKDSNLDVIGLSCGRPKVMYRAWNCFSSEIDLHLSRNEKRL